MNSRIVLIFLSLTIVWCLIALRAAQLQILPDSRLKDLQRRQYNTLIELPARRGLVTDRKGHDLAVTIPRQSLFADPKEIEKPKHFARVLAKKLGYSPAYVYERIKNRERRFVWLKRFVKKEFADQLKELKLKGLGFVEESARIYPNEKLLSQVLGFVGIEGNGLEGLELHYDSFLKGKNRKIKIEKDARGRPLLVDGRVFTDVPAGYDLQLTIDADLQFMLESELMRAMTEQSGDSALGVVLDAQTSEVLAIAHVPTFDPNRPHDFPQEFLRDRTITDAFEPGSTVKTLIVAAGLRAGTLKPSKKYFCENGRMKVGKYYIREADVHHSFGTLDVTEILAKSSNIGVTKIGLELGADKVRQALLDFGFGQKTGVDLPGEARGTVQALPWRDHLLANVSFGHGVTATPMQIVAAYAAIANDGVLRSPYIVRSAVNQETGERVDYKSKNIRRVLSPEQAATMRLMLNAATNDKGTGAAARVAGFPVAGKTGTAQKVIVGQGYAKDQYVSSFAGFIPASNPKYVIYVAIDNPRNKYYGAEVAAPLFSRVAGYAVRQGGLAPVLISEKSVVKKNNAAHEASLNKIREMAKVLSAEEQNKTPDFTGLTLREVYNRVRGTPIQLDIRGRGVVSLSIPGPGDVLPEDKMIRLYLDPVQ